ncbi:MAG: MFS transporter [Halieaceae bacterium]
MKSFVPLIRAEWQLLLFGFVMTFSSSLGQTYFIGLFSGEIRADLELSHGDFGAVYSAATLASAIILLWSGALIDRVDLRRFTYTVTAGLAIGCFLIAGSTGIATLFVSILVLRHLGQGLMSMAGATTMVRYLDRHKAKANALSGIGYSLSEAILPSLVIALLAVLSWRESWVFWACILLLLVPLLTMLLLRGHDNRHAAYLNAVSPDGGDNQAESRKQWTRHEVIRDPLFYMFMPALLAQPMLFTGFMFHQVHLVEVKGWSLTVWGSIYLLYALVSTLFKLLTGVIADRVGALRLIPVMCIPFGLGFLLLAASNGLWVAVAFMSLMAVTIGIYSTISSPFFSEMYGTLHLGSIKSVTTAAMVFASAIAPVLMGWLIDSGVSMESMAVASACYIALASMLAAIAVRKKLQM